MIENANQGKEDMPVSERQFKIGTIKMMLDANAFLPQTRIPMRLASALRYLEGRENGFTYDTLGATKEDVQAENFALARLVTARLAQEHRAPGRDIHIKKQRSSPGEALERYGLWYAGVYNEGIDMAEHLIGIALQSGLSSHMSIAFAQDVLEEVKRVFELPAFENVIRRFRDETEGRDEGMLKNIIETARRVFLSGFENIRIRYGANIPSEIIETTARLYLFAPQGMIKKDV